MSRARRKIDHIHHAIQTGQNRSHGFEDIQFIHQSIPNLSVNDVSITCTMGELILSSPIVINAMTGGGGQETTRINQLLSSVAKECGLAIAVGSQMSAIKDPSERPSYDIVRKENPNGIIFANIGSEANVEQAKQAVDMIEANGLQIHLNVVQELVMPEGDRDFTNALKRIEKIVQSIEVPVIVKEVGYGMSRETAHTLKNIGVNNIDIGGYGGTNFSKIENERRERRLKFFDDWGIPTTVSLIEVASSTPDLNVVASGGIMNALDILKSLRLGASCVGMAGYILKILLSNGVESVVEEVQNIHEDTKLLMTALGKKNVQAIRTSPIIINGKTHHWLNQRGIDTKSFSQTTTI